MHSWMRELFWTPGPEADERRHRVFSRMYQDPTGFPDSIGLGPFGPRDERARQLTLGIGYRTAMRKIAILLAAPALAVAQTPVASPRIEITFAKAAHAEAHTGPVDVATHKHV